MRTASFFLLLLALPACSEGQPGPPEPDLRPEFGKGKIGTLDPAEETHLVFMREEEKLARDVYKTLGKTYPDLETFDQIDDAEQTHTNTVADLLDLYGIEDPSTSNQVGAFTGADYGSYFIEKYDLLTAQGEISGLEALYAGAYIEELDMKDIRFCPKVIQVLKDLLEEDCGLVYTGEATIQRVYERLIDGSKSHLRAYVKIIEQTIGEGEYEAQVLPQDEVDDILGR